MGEKKDNVTVVLKADLHCEGCATKVIKCIRSFDGVDTVTTGEGQMITVVGNVDPVKLREKVVQKTHKTVELISPQPKDKNKENNDKNGKNGKNKDSKEDNKKKPKEKEIPVTTAVFKVNLHCDGCIHKLYKTVTKTKGYGDMEIIDKEKDLVSVTGAIDMKALAEVLSKQLRKDVEIVPPKKDGGKKDAGGKKEKKGDGGKKDAGGKKEKKGDCDEKAEGGNKQMQQALVGGYPYPVMSGPVLIGDQIHYNPSPVHHAPQIFSDENPNACSVM